MKNVYLLMTDLHADTEKANRLNYFGEVLTAMQDTLNIAQKYKDAGYNVNMMFLGDVFDTGSSNPSDAMQLMEVFYFFTSMFSQVWSVVGNHEISYAENNPFWYLVAEMQDESLSMVRRFIQPRGLTSRIVVPDRVTDGDTVFYFNHYGTPAKTPDTGKIRIGLFHQNVGSNEICKMWGTFDNVEEAAYIQGYNYCYFGHMHLAHGEYWLNEQHTCKGEWLGTIGRTKVDEIQDDCLEVNIPAVIVVDGKFVTIESNYITLKNREETVDVPKYEASKKSREIVAQRRNSAVSNYKGDTLFETLEGSFMGTPSGFLLHLLDKPWGAVYTEYRNTLDNLPTSGGEEEVNDGAESGGHAGPDEQVQD